MSYFWMIFAIERTVQGYNSHRLPISTQCVLYQSLWNRTSPLTVIWTCFVFFRRKKYKLIYFCKSTIIQCVNVCKFNHHGFRKEKILKASIIQFNGYKSTKMCYKRRYMFNRISLINCILVYCSLILKILLLSYMFDCKRYNCVDYFLRKPCKSAVHHYHLYCISHMFSNQSYIDSNVFNVLWSTNQIIIRIYRLYTVSSINVSHRIWDTYASFETSFGAFMM